jgi:hypothetical protein
LIAQSAQTHPALFQVFLLLPTVEEFQKKSKEFFQRFLLFGECKWKKGGLADKMGNEGSPFTQGDGTGLTDTPTSIAILTQSSSLPGSRRKVTRVYE